jgi:hypothetical protein
MLQMSGGHLSSHLWEGGGEHHISDITLFLVFYFGLEIQE